MLEEISNTSKEALTSSDFRQWLNTTNASAVNKALIRGTVIFGVPASVAAHQWQAIQKLKKKAPELVRNQNIIFPPNFFLEQTSSRQSCIAKIQWFKKLNVANILDVTGGFGLDAVYLSPHFKYTHIEHNPSLQMVAAHNFRALGLNVDTLAQDGIQYLIDQISLDDWVYADPQRRDENNSRSFLLEDHIPTPADIIFHAKKLAKGCIIKLSPMVDISMLLKQETAPFYSAAIVIEVKQEVKEILWILSRESLDFEIGYAHVNNQEQVRSILNPTYDPFLPIEHDTSNIDPYICIPNPGLVKSKLQAHVAQHHNLKWLDDHKRYFSGTLHPASPLVRCFRKLSELPTSTAKLKKSLKGANYHVISAHPKMPAEQISSKFGLIPKGDKYIIIFQQLGKSVAFLTEKCETVSSNEN